MGTSRNDRIIEEKFSPDQVGSLGSTGSPGYLPRRKTINVSRSATLHRNLIRTAIPSINEPPLKRNKQGDLLFDMRSDIDDVQKELTNMVNNFGEDPQTITGLLISKDQYVITGGKDRIIRF